MKRGSNKFLSRFSKRGVLGIETLIIFIAMILVAAVAAGVLIRTSGLLQQRALMVSGETITRVATGIELIQITANADTTANSIREMEMLLRLGAGSDTIKMRDVGLTYISGEIYLTAALADESNLNYDNVTLTYIDNTTDVDLYNLDNNLSDTAIDTAKFFSNIGGSGYDGFQFKLSHEGTFNVSLNRNLSDKSDVLVEDIPIKNGEDVFGYIYLSGDFGTVDNVLNASSTAHNFTLDIRKYPDECSFEKLRPDKDYCIEARIGDKDAYFDSGELLFLRYKLSEENELMTNTEVELSLVPSKAMVTTIAFFTPEAFPTYKVTLWP